EALDFYMSSHPLAQHEDVLRRFATHTVSQLGELPGGQDVLLGGMLTQLQYRNTKNSRNGNTRYLIARLEDFTSAAKCVIWAGDEFRINPATVAKAELETLLGAGRVEFSRHQANGNGRNGK